MISFIIINVIYFKQKDKCKFKHDKVGARVSGHVVVPKDEEQLKQVVATKGPVTVAVDSSRFFGYKTGKQLYFMAFCQKFLSFHK